MSKTKAKSIKLIHSLDEIPAFASKDEERDWWAVHAFSEELAAKLPDATARHQRFIRQHKRQRAKKPAATRKA